MISFRYHIVSIVAVFLALALGIVIGTTALNGPITTDLRHQVNTLKGDRSNLAGQVKTLNAQLDDANQFATTYGSKLVSGALDGTNVLEIAMPNASAAAQSGVADDISAAGGKVAGKIELSPDFIDQARGSDIVSLATGAARPIEWTAPETNDSGQLGGSLLAWVLTGKGQATELTSVLSAFSQLHMLSASNTLQPSTTVVVVGTGSMAKNSYGSGMELALVQWLQKQGGNVVVAGDAASDTGGGLVAAVRGDAVKSHVSSVDNADTAIGQVSAVLATAGIAKNVVGHYGTGSGAGALFPNPVTK